MDCSGSGDGDGERKERFSRSLEYRCVRRFRLRRLLGFLWFNNYNGAFESLCKETTVFFRVEHLQRLVRLGLWSDARDYLFHIVPAFHLPAGGQFLALFMRFLTEIAEYEPTDPSTYPDYDPYSRHQIRRQGGVDPGGVKISQIIRSVCSKEAWGYINWPLVRFKAAGTWLIRFQSFMRFADCRSAPSSQPECFPSAQGISRGHSRLQKKSLGRMPADVLARSFLSKKRTHYSSQGTDQSGLPPQPFTMIRLAEIIDECLQAGKRQVLNDKLPIESSCTEGTTHTMVAEAAIYPDFNLKNDPKRPRATEHQEVNIQENDR